MRTLGTRTLAAAVVLISGTWAVAAPPPPPPPPPPRDTPIVQPPVAQPPLQAPVAVPADTLDGVNVMHPPPRVRRLTHPRPVVQPPVQPPVVVQPGVTVPYVPRVVAPVHDGLGPPPPPPPPPEWPQIPPGMTVESDRATPAPDVARTPAVPSTPRPRITPRQVDRVVAVAQAPACAPHRSGVWLEVLFFTPDPANTVFATENDAAGGSNARRLERDVEQGLRGGFRYAPAGSRWDFSVQGMHLATDSGGTAVAPAGGSIGTSLYTPGNAPATVAGPATASSDIDITTIDVTAGRSFDLSTSVATRAFVGFRYASLDQSYDVTYNDVPRANVYERASRMDMSAYGVVLGAEAHVALSREFSFFGRVAGGVVFGDFSGSLRETQVMLGGGRVDQVNARGSFDSTVPMLELGAGITWTCPRLWSGPGVRVSLGYEYHVWFDVADVNQSANPAALTQITQRTSDISFDGLTFKLELTF